MPGPGVVRKKKSRPYATSFNNHAFEVGNLRRRVAVQALASAFPKSGEVDFRSTANWCMRVRWTKILGRRIWTEWSRCYSCRHYDY